MRSGSRNCGRGAGCCYYHAISRWSSLGDWSPRCRRSRRNDVRNLSLLLYRGADWFQMESIVRDQTAVLKCVQAGLVSLRVELLPSTALSSRARLFPETFRPTGEELEQIVKDAKK